MDEWKGMFRDIYGRSPSPGDIDLAPTHLKEKLKAETEATRKDDIVQEKRGVKRKNFEMKIIDGEQFSPMKKRVPSKNLDTPVLSMPNDSNIENIRIRTSPRKKIELFNLSPMKASFSSPKTKLFSPKKSILTPKSARRVNFDDVSPMKTFPQNASTSKSSRILTPIKSPSKQTFQRELVVRKGLELLLEPTPEKVEKTYEDFEDETTDEVASARGTGGSQRRLVSAKKEAGENFQKINLRKKQFVRGKVTAEQKRKMKKKQMFKRKGFAPR